MAQEIVEYRSEHLS